jgi:hypothetical protein
MRHGMHLNHTLELRYVSLYSKTSRTLFLCDASLLQLVSVACHDLQARSKSLAIRYHGLGSDRSDRSCTHLDHLACVRIQRDDHAAASGFCTFFHRAYEGGTCPDDTRRDALQVAEKEVVAVCHSQNPCIRT